MAARGGEHKIPDHGSGYVKYLNKNIQFSFN